jgi:hypothetical protein
MARSRGGTYTIMQTRIERLTVYLSALSLFVGLSVVTVLYYTSYAVWPIIGAIVVFVLYFRFLLSMRSEPGLPAGSRSPSKGRKSGNQIPMLPIMAAMIVPIVVVVLLKAVTG